MSYTAKLQNFRKYVIRAHHKEYDRSFEGRFCQLERKLTGR